MIRSAAVRTVVATVATSAAFLVGLAGAPAAADESELSDEHIAELCADVDRVTADDLPEGVELPELRAACERRAARTPDNAEEPLADEQPPVEPDSAAAPEPDAVTNPRPTTQPEPTAEQEPTAEPRAGEPTAHPSASQLPAAAAAPTAPPTSTPRQSGNRSHSTGAASPPPGVTIEVTGPLSPATVEPPQLATAAPIAQPPTERFLADLPPAGLAHLPLAHLPLAPLPAAPEFGLLGSEPESRPTDLDAAGSVTALPTESPQLPPPVVLAAILLAAVGTALVRAGASSASRGDWG